MSTYCRGGCVTGLSPSSTDPGASGMRASIGIGFADQSRPTRWRTRSAMPTAACTRRAAVRRASIRGSRTRAAQIGAWGYDILSKALISPAKGRDIMGYCRNEWVSDYTYNALFNRIAAISEEQKMVVTPSPRGARRAGRALSRRHRGRAGELAWDGAGDLDLDDDLKGGSIVSARFLSASGAEMVSRPARFFRFDHLPGGFLFVPQEPGVQWKSLRVDGYREQLLR